MINHEANNNVELGDLKEEIVKLRDLFEVTQQAQSPIVSLDAAAKTMFRKSPKVVKGWIKAGYLRAYAIPDGKRGHSYYFLREQLTEDVEHNFKV